MGPIWLISQAGNGKVQPAAGPEYGTNSAPKGRFWIERHWKLSDGTRVLRRKQAEIYSKAACLLSDAGNHQKIELPAKIAGPSAQSGSISPKGVQGGDGGRYRIRTYDFHRVKVALYR